MCVRSLLKHVATNSADDVYTDLVALVITMRVVILTTMYSNCIKDELLSCLQI
jgi:hypothetical protein